MSPSITHVIFDLDGLLIDTESQYTQATASYCEKFGKSFTWEVKSKQMGRKPMESARILIDELEIMDTPENCHAFIHDRLYELFPSCKLLPGAQELVEHMSAHSIPLAIASGSSNEDFKYKCQNHHNLVKHFSHWVLSGSDPEVTHGKPAPDIFQVAAKRFPSPPTAPGNCLVFEDAPNGVEAALAAGMHVIWVPDSRCDRSAFVSDVRVRILDSLCDFHPEEFGLPTRP